jgi:hypothetical protein
MCSDASYFIILLIKRVLPLNGLRRRGILGFGTWVGAPPKIWGVLLFGGGGGSPSYGYKPRYHSLHSPISKWGDINNVWVHQLHLLVITHFLYSRLYALSLTSLILIMIFIFRFGGKCSPPQNLAIFWFCLGIRGTPEAASPCTNPFKFCFLIFHQYS